MNTTRPTKPRPPLESLACVHERCEHYGPKGPNNLTVGKISGKEGRRNLRCRRCGEAFSERKTTALWNTKVAEDQALAVAEPVAEGGSVSSTARLVKGDASVVRRLHGKLGAHGDGCHDERVTGREEAALEAEERHG